MLVYLTHSPSASVWSMGAYLMLIFPSLEKKLKTTAARIASIDPGRPSQFLATRHALLLLLHRTEHCWEVLVFHPSWQPIKKQLEFCRAIEDKGHSPGCSVRITAAHYPQGIINSQQQYHANQSERKSSPQPGVCFRGSSSARAKPLVLMRETLLMGAGLQCISMSLQ